MLYFSVIWINRKIKASMCVIRRKKNTFSWEEEGSRKFTSIFIFRWTLKLYVYYKSADFTQNIGLVQEFSQFRPNFIPMYIFQRLMYELFCGWHLPKTAKLAIKAMFFGLLWPFVTTETNVIHSNLNITNLDIVNFAI